MRNIIRICYVICIVFAGSVASGNAIAADAAGNAKDPFTYFYRSPDLSIIPDMVRKFEADGSFSKNKVRPPIIGFMAALFSRHPDQVNHWLSTPTTSHALTALATSLCLAGKKEQALQVAKRRGLSEEFQTYLTTLPTSLLQLPVNTASVLDMLWGASFATGDRKYPDRIVETLGQFIESGRYDVDDIVTISNIKKDRSRSGNKKLGEKYGKEKFLELALAGVAAWALGSNAKQHAFVRQTVEARYASAAKSDFGYVLRRILFRSSTKTIEDAAGTHFELIFSKTADGSAVKKYAENTEQESLGDPEILFSKFKNEYDGNENIDAVILLYVRRGTGITATVFLEQPNGDRVHLKNFELAKSGKERIVLEVVPIASSDLPAEGIYSLHGTFADNHDETVTSTTRFYKNKD